MNTVTLYRPRGKKIWYAKWLMPDGRYKKRSLKIEDRKLAEEAKRKIEESMFKQEFNIKHSLDMDPETAWSAYESLLFKKDQNTPAQKRIWLEFFAKRERGTVAAVRRIDAAVHTKYLQEKYEPSTARLYLSYLSRIYQRLIDEELIQKINPFSGRRIDGARERKLRVIDWSLIERVMDAEAGSPLYFMLVLGGMLGMRKGEMDQARWEDINWDAGEICVRGTKTDGSLATLPLHTALRARLEPYKQPNGWIIQYRYGGDHRYRCDTQDLWEKARAKHGLGEARIHDLRHSFATRLLALGYSMTDIAKMMRHTSTRMTERYADLRTVKVVIGDISGAAGERG